MLLAKNRRDARDSARTVSGFCVLVLVAVLALAPLAEVVHQIDAHSAGADCSGQPSPCLWCLHFAQDGVGVTPVVLSACPTIITDAVCVSMTAPVSSVVPTGTLARAPPRS
jgi:hypothetical protein